MTTPRDESKTAAKSGTTSTTSSAQRTDKQRAEQMDAAAAARRELHSPLETATLPAVFGDELFEQWAAQVKADDRYRLYDPGNPDATTSSAGGNPPPALIVQYGDGPRDYVATSFDSGQVLVQDAADPTGKTWKFPESAWRRFVARVRGEEVPGDEQEEGPTQYEAAAEQNQRTADLLQADRDATQAAARRADGER